MKSRILSLLSAIMETGGICLAQTNLGAVGAFRSMLKKQGIKNVYYESQGTAHEWLTWRRDLFQFAQLLFM
jgi:enterochelin esterase-like enzyme